LTAIQKYKMASAPVDYKGFEMLSNPFANYTGGGKHIKLKEMPFNQIAKHLKLTNEVASLDIRLPSFPAVARAKITDEDQNVFKDIL